MVLACTMTRCICSVTTYICHRHWLAMGTRRPRAKAATLQPLAGIICVASERTCLMKATLSCQPSKSRGLRQDSVVPQVQGKHGHERAHTHTHTCTNTHSHAVTRPSHKNVWAAGNLCANTPICGPAQRRSFNIAACSSDGGAKRQKLPAVVRSVAIRKKHCGFVSHACAVCHALGVCLPRACGAHLQRLIS